MSDVEQEILRALAELAEAVERVRTASPKPDLMRLFVRIDELAARLPQDADPDLIHYLQRKSYDKARLWLQRNSR